MMRTDYPSTEIAAELRLASLARREVSQDRSGPSDASKIVIRAMTNDDVSRVIELLSPIAETAFLEWEDPALLISHLETQDSCSLIALHYRDLVGAIIAGSIGVRGAISHIAIAEPYRRLGVASALVDRVLSGFRARGLRRVFLFAGDANSPAHGLWAHCGFAQTRGETTWERDL
jgi:N-acetylglutamate synthase